MARARGSNATVAGVFETAVGTTPGSGFFKLPIVSHTLGEERALIASNLLGQGREMQDPTPDVANNDGDIVVPVDVRNIGQWLKLFMGAPVTTGSGPYTHAFASGAASLPSMSIEVGAPEVPAYSTHYGVRGNQMRIAMGRSGLLDATCSLIAIGESTVTSSSVAGSPTTATPTRFPNATGFVNKDGSTLGSVVAASFTLSNNLDKVETIKSDGRIEDADPGMVSMTGSVTVRFKDMTLLNAADGSTPMELDFGWSAGPYSLLFQVPRVFLPRSKRPIPGPNGIQVEFNWQASAPTGHAVAATLINDVASYA